MRLFDLTGDPRHDRHERVSTRARSTDLPLGGSGIVALKKVSSGAPNRKASEMADQLRARWDDVLERLGIAGYVYGPPTMFHVYFETDPSPDFRGKSVARTYKPAKARRLKGMPGRLVADYQRWLRHYGVDLLSGTGGVLSDAHTGADIDQATEAFEKTVVALRDDKQNIHAWLKRRKRFTRRHGGREKYEGQRRP